KNITDRLIPIVFAIDLSNKISHVPGTTWGGHIEIIHSLNSKKQLNSTVSRILSRSS
ncbi:MAG: hypothetical protein UZ22_OP11002000636, partial [Microgenomates bacterium OLB23]